MLKLMLCMVFLLAGSATALALRQQELELNHQIVALQSRIQGRQAKLWNQHVRIGIATAPEAIRRGIGDDSALVPEFAVHQEPPPRIVSAQRR